MNTYVKIFMVASVCVALAGVVIQEVIERHKAEITKILNENPSLKVASQTAHELFPVFKFLRPVFTYFPSLRKVLSFLLPPPESTPTTASTLPPATPATPTNTKKAKERLFTPQQLKAYDGKDASKGPYLAILGRVYNVRKGKKHYGPGGGYEFFSGRDASRAYVSGDFTEAGLIDDVSGLSSTDYIGLDEWVKFYDTDYKYVGKLIGRYYDENGEPTLYYYDTQRWISQAFTEKENDNQEKKMFPPCNSEWNPETGSRLWCTKRSGGIERDWVGVPRKLFMPGQSKSRCACVKNFGAPSHDPKRINHDRGDLDHPNLQEYPKCEPDQPECYVKLD
ncbi:hypothetical protein O3P69_007007 [Scylla paramamosain]|uniref:Cytochrome b5 heme-binding domain-containing protein n=1 Tax=Scylla paramamosain TaxID=85552 RepID=A0AAW0V1D3_SCYPA